MEDLEDPRCFKVYFQTKALMEEVRRTGDASPLFYTQAIPLNWFTDAQAAKE